MATLPEKDLLDRIQAFLDATGMTPTAFGVAAVKDAKLVPEIEAGRELRRATRERVEAYMGAFSDRVKAAVGPSSGVTA